MSLAPKTAPHQVAAGQVVPTLLPVPGGRTFLGDVVRGRAQQSGRWPEVLRSAGLLAAGERFTVALG